MAFVSIYMNFQGRAQEAFNHYKKVFKIEFWAPLIRKGDLPSEEGMPPSFDTDKMKVMHVALPILGGTEIMAADILESLGQKFIEGHNITISLNPDTKEEADRLYKELSIDSTDGIAPHDEFWGYWGTCKDKFGIRWMFNITNQQF